MKKKRNEKSTNRHFVFIEAPMDMVGPEIILWGEAEWWPKECVMTFTRLGGGDINVGTQYQLKVNKPLGPQWKAEVEEMVPTNRIKRKFSDGMFEGYEIVRISERSNGTRVDYEMRYIIKGMFNQLLWKFIYKKEHNKNIKLILRSLKAYVLEKKKHEEERKFEEK